VDTAFLRRHCQIRERREMYEGWELMNTASSSEHTAKHPEEARAKKWMREGGSVLQ
jgi:hypothetical protein